MLNVILPWVIVSGISAGEVAPICIHVITGNNDCSSDSVLINTRVLSKLVFLDIDQSTELNLNVSGFLPPSASHIDSSTTDICLIVVKGISNDLYIWP